jgi:cellulose synthase/poly-beta-1,6-N-acetylglucosamine synthase-like glycosyltransferase
MPTDCALPALSLLISAYNEADVIEARITNALAMDYPADKLEIIIACDGCSDATADIVARYTDRGVRLLNSPVRRGKTRVLNSAIAAASGEVVLLSDANTEIDPAAARQLARWFADPGVGSVCGRLILQDAATGRNVDGLYWKYETFLKVCEGRLGALLGANGAIYAIRRELFVAPPPDTIVDDFVIPLLIRLRSGHRIVYEPGATAVEETAADIAGEFRRRARIGAGGFQSITCLYPLLNPLRGWTAFTFLSHKLLRWLCPFFLLGAAATSMLLASHPLYRAALLTQAAFYATAVGASLLPPGIRLLKPLRLTTLFTSMNVALLIGFFRWATGSQNAAWSRTARTPTAAADAA